MVYFCVNCTWKLESKIRMSANRSVFSVQCSMVTFVQVTSVIYSITFKILLFIFFGFDFLPIPNPGGIEQPLLQKVL